MSSLTTGQKHDLTSINMKEILNALQISIRTETFLLMPFFDLSVTGQVQTEAYSVRRIVCCA